MEIKTMKVKAKDPEQGEFVIINESDFDPETQEEYREPGDPLDVPETVAELKAWLTEKGIEIPEGARKSDLLDLYTENK